MHTQRFQVSSCVQDATVLHASCGKVSADTGRDSSQVVLIRELLEGAEDDKHPCKRIRVEVSRMLGHESDPANDRSKTKLHDGCCGGRVPEVQFAVDPQLDCSTVPQRPSSAQLAQDDAPTVDGVFLQGEEMQLGIRSDVAGGAGL